MTRAILASILLAGCGGGGGGGGDDTAGPDAGPTDPCLPPGSAFFVRTGDPATGVDGAVFGGLGIAPVIGPEGTVAFTGYADTADATVPGLWHFNGGATIEPIAIVGQALAVPGAPVPLGVQGSPVIARDHRVGFQLTLEGEPDRPVAIFDWAPVTGAAALRVIEGQAAGPAGEPFEMIEPFFREETPSAFGGRLLFSALYQADAPAPCPVVTGVWGDGDVGDPFPLAVCGTPAPGVGNELMFRGAMSEVQAGENQWAAGAVGLMNSSLGGEGTALYRFNLAAGGAPELVHQVARPGTPDVPTVLRLVRLNPAGEIAFVEESPGVVRRFDEGGLRALILEDDPAPGVAGATVGRITGLALRADGLAVVASELAGGVADGRAAVFAQTSVDELALVAYEGMEVPGLAGTTIQSIAVAHANDAGQVLLRVRLEGGAVVAGDTALLAWSGGALEVLLAAGSREGCELAIDDVNLLSDQIPDQPLQVFGPGHGGNPRGLTADGRAVVHLSYFEAGLFGEALAIIRLP